MRWYNPALHHLLLVARKLCEAHFDNIVLSFDLEDIPISQ